MLSPKLFSQRRRAFQKRMAADSVALLFSAPIHYRNRDVSFPFRQDSDLYYLTGFNEEEAILLLTPERERLYLRQRNPEREVWEGRRCGIEEARQALQIEETADIALFWGELRKILRHSSLLYYRFGQESRRDQRLLATAWELFHQNRGGQSSPHTIVLPDTILQEMRLVKSPQELQLLQRSASITAAAHTAAMQRVKPDMYEYEVDALLKYEMQRLGALEAYPTIAASGPNACILHYTGKSRQLRPGELLLIDAGAEKDFLCADVTRTFPVGVSFSGAQRDLYQIVLEAQRRAIAASVAGSSMELVHRAAAAVVTQGLIDLSILQGSVEEHLERVDAMERREKPGGPFSKRDRERSPAELAGADGAGAGRSSADESGAGGLLTYKRFFMHRTGHWLGMDVHDAGSYYQKGEPRKLVDGMVLTVEPGLYFSADEEAVPEELRGIGIRIEDDIVVQQQSPINLTASIPKEIDDIEAMRTR